MSPEMLQTAVAGTKAGEFRREGHAYRILVQLKKCGAAQPGRHP